VIAHDGKRHSGIHHTTSDVDDAQLRRTTIHEVADEDDLSLGMPPRACGVTVVEFPQQSFQLVGMSVDIADDVVAQSASSSVPVR
jgi:hypothetical protein